MTAIELATARLAVEEGFRGTAYRDQLGKLTIGYGFNVDAGITQYAAKALLEAQVTEINNNLATYAWWHALDDVRASVILDLAINMGTSGLLHFVNMLAAIGRKDWQAAHDELLDSQAAKMLPTRYRALAQILLTGVA